MKTKLFKVVVAENGRVTVTNFVGDVLAEGQIGLHNKPWVIEDLMHKIRAEVEDAYHLMQLEAANAAAGR